ncbi:MAG: hypothetical protein V7L23_15360 [Nostoc sp.]|uniref:hypothetical protein n=1 Tax=Nostoc sp. TaxID=1180 RepID=UPI002FF2C6A2
MISHQKITRLTRHRYWLFAQAILGVGLVVLGLEIAIAKAGGNIQVEKNFNQQPQEMLF